MRSRGSAVEFVRTPFAHVEHAVSGEEVVASLTTAWHAKGFTGKGVKVAVIDGGFQGLERQAEGEMPANVVSQDFCGNRATATDHGTAVAEIVHEMAPDAQLYLVCVDTEVDLAAAEAYANGQGIHVINHSMGWQGRSATTGVVRSARSSLLLERMGSFGSTRPETKPRRTGRAPIALPAVCMPGAEGDLGNTFVWPNGEVICGFLKWDEWPAGVSDFDLGLLLSGANVFSRARGEQTGRESPYEELCVEQSSGADLTVFWAIRGYRVSTSPRLDLESWSRRLSTRSRLEASPRRRRRRRPSRRRPVLAAETARAVQLAGPDDRRAGQARHRRSRQRLERDLRPIHVVSVGVAGDVGVVSRGRRRRRSRQAGVSELRAGSGQAAAHARGEGSRSSGPRQCVRRG